MTAGSAIPQAAASADAPGDYVRLHITPLDQDLFKLVVPTSLQPAARNVSFHTIETFPERRFGFVDLPQMDADKLKKKLHGAVLKGTKIRIEPARPEERPEPTGHTDATVKKRKKSHDGLGSSKKRKRQPDVLEGVTLRDRKVKRGWTESGDTMRKHKKSKDKDKDKDGRDGQKRKRLKSKYTEKEECLLKVKVPPNAMANLSQEQGSRTSRKKSKSREVTIHEFERTTQFPSFLKQTAPETSGKPATEYVEGKGWVDEDGNVVEAVKTRVPANPPKRQEEEEEEEEEEAKLDQHTASTSKNTRQDEDETTDTSSDESSEESSDEDSPAKEAESTTPLSAGKKTSPNAASPVPSKNLTIKILPQTTPSATGVHPLEALYKRPKGDAGDQAQTPAAQAEPFSFFGGTASSGSDCDSDSGEGPDRPTARVPMTPFTRQDLEQRVVRSAAPTPDTAHPSRTNSLWPPGPDEEENEEDEVGDDGDDGAGQGAPAEQSDFQSWFWDNRRDLNRSWMSRRKSAAKEKRHRENKARASKAV
ncbi:hypothetical protein HIM_08954 [Hirsutella minnesotensis 3608]|uniref:Uncharacterized protein n=1 Tax=Hirsutella minnesotensis 3608 TaxID=1043627 RepID=A0A0F7ZY07_9HYPO|nr:hypothetical protein HIM_08954 [Hirsutella minnesotensis 3608]